MGGVRLLKASAGSGKTYQLAYSFIRDVVREPALYSHILAVTFTNKATEEMKRRILSEINDLAEGRITNYTNDLLRDTGLAPAQIKANARLARSRILHDFSHFSVLTIDKFFQRIIRAFIKELGIDLNFNLELQTDNLLATASDSLLDDLSVDSMLRNWITAFVEERINENRRWDVRSGIISMGAQLFREGYRSGELFRLDKQALGEIVGRLDKRCEAVLKEIAATGTQAMTLMTAADLAPADFSGGARSFANYFVKASQGEFTAYGAAVSSALASDEKWAAKTSPRKGDIINLIPALKPLLARLCTLYDNNATFINSAALIKANYRNFALLSDLSAKIGTICAEESIVPIAETNHILNKLISDNDTPFIFEKAGNRFDAFMIDEFQDTSELQWRNFLPLLHNAVSQSEDNPVLLVGDVKQSIYRWRGGDWRILAEDIGRRFASLSETDLDTNWRSRPCVVEFNNTIVGECVAADDALLSDRLSEACQSGAITSAKLEELCGMLSKAYHNHKQKAAPGKSGGHVTITYYKPSPEDEKAIPPVIARIEELQQRGYAPGDIAVLVRTNSQGTAVADMLLAHKAANPLSPYSYDVVTQEALLVGSDPAVSFVIACLKLAVNGKDNISLALYNQWLERDFDTPAPECEQELLKTVRLMPVQEAYEKVMASYSLADESGHTAYLQALHEQVIRFSNNKVSDIALFIKWWDENGAGQPVGIPQDGSAITIITIHKAKGLQFKTVLVPYCDWSLNPRVNSLIWSSAREEGIATLGNVPIPYCDKMSRSYFAEDYYNEQVLSHIDNINLFYVAVTRAEDELHLMIPSTATGKTKSDRISTLISEVVHDDGQRATLAAMEGTATECCGNLTVSFGAPVAPETAKAKNRQLAIRPTLRSYETQGRLKLKLGSSRYIDDGATGNGISPRNYGRLMHSAFESARTMEEIMENISDMEKEGIVSAAEAGTLKNTIEESFTDERVRSWFRDQWSRVRNESDIILPRGNGLRRPDRVMIDGDKAVVVDYKFGLERAASHRRQVAAYVELLGQMGYVQTRGYIWYVSLNDIEEVV